MGKSTSWGTGAQAVFGYEDAEIVRQPFDVLFTMEDRTNGVPAIELRLAREAGRAKNERWQVRKDGSVFYGSGSMMPLRDKGGAIQGFVKIMRDLTETKRTEEAMRVQMDELTRFNDAAVGRESRMIELKQEVNDLARALGQAPRYDTGPMSEPHQDS